MSEPQQLIVATEPPASPARTRPPERGSLRVGGELDLDQRRDWLELFPFLDTRRPDAYGPLV